MVLNVVVFPLYSLLYLQVAHVMVHMLYRWMIKLFISGK